MCDLIEKLFMNIKPEDVNIGVGNEVFTHYDKDRDELLALVGKLMAENHSLTQRLVGLDIWLKEILGEFFKENFEKDEVEKDEGKDI
jgi:hypothetical protein